MLTLLEGHKYSKEFGELLKISILAKRVFQVANPGKYYAYNGNCCRQMAYICKTFMSRFAPEYEWKAYESKFTWVSKDTPYEHAWCYGTCKSKPGILIDLAFDTEYMNNYLVEGQNLIPCMPEHIEDVKARVEIDDTTFDQNEFYTGLPGKKLIEVLDILYHTHKEDKTIELRCDTIRNRQKV